MDNNFEEVEFGTGWGYRVSDPKMYNDILEKLQNKYNIRVGLPHKKYFRQLIASDDYHFIRTHPHKVCYELNSAEIKTALLYLTRYSGVNLCLYIYTQNENNAKIDIIAVKHRFDDELYHADTVFEGELLIKCNHFLITDLLIFRGREYVPDRNNNFDKKLTQINSILHGQFKYDEMLDILTLKLKDYVDYIHVNSLITDHAEKLPYKDLIVGLLFSPIDNYSNKIFVAPLKIFNIKNNPSQEYTKNTQVFNINEQVQFNMIKTKKPDIYELYHNEKFYGIASIPDKRTSQLALSLFSTRGGVGVGVGKVKVVCVYDSNFGRWKPIAEA